MIVTVNKTASHQWAGQTVNVPDGTGLSMIRRGIATAGGKLDPVAGKDPDLIPQPDVPTKRAAKKK